MAEDRAYRREAKRLLRYPFDHFIAHNAIVTSDNPESDLREENGKWVHVWVYVPDAEVKA